MKGVRGGRLGAASRRWDGKVMADSCCSWVEVEYSMPPLLGATLYGIVWRVGWYCIK